MAFTALPAAGAKLRAATLSSLISEIRPITARKTVDETVNNSAVLQDDDELFVALAASTTYRIALDLVWNSGTTPDFKYDWTVPSGATGLYTVTATSGAALFLGSLAFASGGNLDGSGSDLFSRFEGELVTTNAGTLRLRWAQVAATVSNTVVRAGSLLVATKVQ